MDLLQIGGSEIGRLTLEPGWRWSDDVKPIAGTELCEQAHACYFLSGSMTVRAKDGTEVTYGPGDVAMMEPGHDAWVTGDAPCVVLDWAGFATYAQPAR
jgi:hypothetical protein